MTIQKIDVAYTAVATAENGRDGRVSSDDGLLDVVVNPPKALGGSGAGTNPEQLFAAGYSACFQGALGVVARQEKADISGSTVTAAVSIGKTEAAWLRTGGRDQRDHPQRRRRHRPVAHREGPPGLPVLERDPRQHQGRALGRLSLSLRPTAAAASSREDRTPPRGAVLAAFRTPVR